MRNPFNFESEPLELYSEFDEYSEFDGELEGFDTEMTDLEWEEEVRRGRWIPFRPRAPRFRPVLRHRPPIPRRRSFRRPPGPIIRRRPRSRVVFSEPSIVESGSQGREYVRWVQSSLNRLMGLQLPVNGIMGPETRSAIRSFQERQRLPADGIVGPDTERAIIAARAGQTTGTGDKQPTEPSDSQSPGPGDSQPSEPGEFEAFDTDSEFDEEYEYDETYPEFEDGYEMEKDPGPVDVGYGKVCGVLYRDFKKMYDSLSDLWEELRLKGSKDKIKKARAALSEDVSRIEGRLRGEWYARKGCKEFDFNWIYGKAVGMTSDKELKADEGVRKMSKRLSYYAQQAAKKARKASQKRAVKRHRSP